MNIDLVEMTAEAVADRLQDLGCTDFDWPLCKDVARAAISAVADFIRDGA